MIARSLAVAMLVVALAMPAKAFAGGGVEPSGRFLYAANLDDASVAAFVIGQSTGALTPVAGSPFATGKDPRGIVASPDGRFVYTVNQVVNQTNGSVSGFAINATTGALSPLPGSPYKTAMSNPLSLAVEPRGHYLYVSGNGIDAYAIDAASGALAAVGSVTGVGAGGNGIAADRREDSSSRTRASIRPPGPLRPTSSEAMGG